MKHNVLICLNRLAVGGVETYVVSQAKALKRKGYGVYIISGKGVYTKTLEDAGITCLEYRFDETNYIDYDVTEKFISILKKYSITEVCIHNFQIINYVTMACILEQVPYMFYLHCGKGFLDGEIKYFAKRNDNFIQIFKLFIENAHKIISINNDNIEYLLKHYDCVNKDQMLLIKNSIDLEDFHSSTYPKEVKNMLYLSRLGKEHHDAIKNTLDFYNQYNKVCNNTLSLRVTGDWEERQFAEKYVKDNKIKGVTFLGGISNVKEEIEKSDLVIALGRGILEASTLNRLALISSYKGIKGILNEDNIEIEFDDNYSGRLLKNINNNKLIDYLKNLKASEIKKIVDKNKQFIKKNLSLENNIYILDSKEKSKDVNYNEIIKTMLIIQNNIEKQKNIYFDKIESNWKEHVKYKEYMESKLANYKKINNNKVVKLIKKIRRFMSRK